MLVGLVPVMSRMRALRVAALMLVIRPAIHGHAVAAVRSCCPRLQVDKVAAAAVALTGGALQLAGVLGLLLFVWVTPGELLLQRSSEDH